jgi:hypothetical protein
MCWAAVGKHVLMSEMLLLFDFRKLSSHWKQWSEFEFAN